MPRITRYWAHDPIGNSEGILAGYEPAALKAAQDRGIIFIAELDDGTRVCSDRFMVAICCCQRSKTYPWCDTSHRRQTRSAADGRKGAADQAQPT